MAALSRFPAMVANSREVAWAPPAGTGKLQGEAQLKDAALAPAVLHVLEARGCNDVAAVKRLSSATLEQMGVPPRYRDALAAALSAPAPATKWGDDDSDDTPPTQSRRRARVDVGGCRSGAGGVAAPGDAGERSTGDHDDERRHRTRDHGGRAV